MYVAERRGVPNLVLNRLWDTGLLVGWSQMRAGLLGMFCLVNCQNLVDLRLVEQVTQLLCRQDRPETRQTRLNHPGVSHGTVTRESVTSSFSAEVTVPSTCSLKNATNTHWSSDELHGTITDTHTAQRKSSSALPVSFVPSGVELVSGNTYINRNGTGRRAGANRRRSREFNVKRNVNLWHNLKSVMKPQRLF